MMSASFCDALSLEVLDQTQYWCLIAAGTLQTLLSSIKKNIYAILVLSYFSLRNLFPNVTSLSVIYRFFRGKCSGELQTLLPTVQTFRARKRHANFTELNHRHFPRDPNERKTFHFEEQTSRVGIFLNISVLTSSNQESIVIYPCYSHKLQFGSTPLSQISHHIYHYHFDCNTLS